MNFKPLSASDPLVQQLAKAKQVEERAEILLAQYDLNGWSFKISRTKTFVGMCYYMDQRIEFSEYFLHEPWEQVEDTLLHEIAHALVGPHVKAHGWHWRLKAIELGANPNRVAENAITSAKHNYLITCGGCGAKWKRHRLKEGYRNGRFRCSRCHSYDLRVDELN